jgi:polar amino acid transport system substrate-binding protein
MRIAARLGLAALVCGTFSGRSPAEEVRTVRIATEAASPPFTFLDAAGEPQGFEIDLAHAFCTAMKARCSFIVRQWDGIIRALVAGDYDAIVASLAITERRSRRIAFSKPYYRIPPAFIGRKDAAPLGRSAAAELQGRRIGAVERTPHARFLEAMAGSVEVKLYGKLEEANLDLLTERIDLVLGDRLSLTRFLESREGACCHIVGAPAADTRLFGEGIAIGLRKEDGALKHAFDSAIDAVIADGTYDRIRAKYFPFDTRVAL